MRLSGSYEFGMPRERVWDALMDPALLASCIEGVRDFAPTGPDSYAFEVAIRVGPVSASYKGAVEVAGASPPESYRLIVSGDGARSSVRGAGDVTLAATGPASTTLTFEGDVQVTGMLARVGQRLLSTVASAQADRFFSCLQAKAGNS